MRFFLLYIKKIPGVTGSTIKIDSHGDSEGNYSVLAATKLTPENRDKYQLKGDTSVNFSCEYVLRPISTFHLSAGSGPVSHFHGYDIKFKNILLI